MSVQETELENLYVQLGGAKVLVSQITGTFFKLAQHKLKDSNFQQLEYTTGRAAQAN